MEKAIQWYPGHMAKAYRIIKEKMPLVDCVIEVLDSRAPLSTHNKMVSDVIGSKPLLIILNKCDMADNNETKKWYDYYSLKYNTLMLNSLNGINNTNLIINALEKLLKEKIEKYKAQSKSIYPIRAMVIGAPNVGKSTLLNSIAKRKAMDTGDRPGVTKNMQYLRANDKLLLLDNPGTLWPKFENEKQALSLALIGSIKDEILPLKTVTRYAIEYIINNYPNEFIKRYNLESLNKSIDDLIDEIGRKRGCIVKGGIVDQDKTYDLILKEIRNQKIGAFTFERVSESI